MQVSPGYDYFIFNDEDVQLKNVDNPSYFWKQRMNGNPWVRIEVLQLSIRLGMSLFTNSAVFFNIVQNPFGTPTPLRFQHLVDFFDGLGDTLHCTKIGQISHRSEEIYPKIETILPLKSLFV